MIVVSDTTPVHYLILLGEESILPAIFDWVIIPEAVAEEMCHQNTPAQVRKWIEAPPDWAIIKSASIDIRVDITRLGKGEVAAISLAVIERADAVLMDDRKAIREARKNGLTTLSTLAVLELAAMKQLLDLEDVLAKLSETSFRMPPQEIVDEYLRRHYDRK